MLTDVLSRCTKEEDKDGYNSTYKNPLWGERWIYLRNFFKKHSKEMPLHKAQKKLTMISKQTLQTFLMEQDFMKG